MLALFGQVRLDRTVKTDRPKDDQGVWMSVSRDDGETWGPMRIVARANERNLCEPFCLRSPDSQTLALVMRENRHRDCSMMCFSSDEGRTWTKPALTAQELTGDRHEGIMLDDGRYLICFRDQMKNSPTAGQYVGWVGSWDDIAKARPGDLRIRLLNHHGKHGVWPGNEWDTGYSGVEKLADGTILCTTYTKHFDDDRYSSVVSTRLYPSDFATVPAELEPLAHEADVFGELPASVVCRIRLWPDLAPGETNDVRGSYVFDGKKQVWRIGALTSPEVVLLKPHNPRSSTLALGIPGGGYVSQNLGSFCRNTRPILESGRWLAVLHHRIPRRPERPIYAAPQEDGQRAVRLLRAQAARFGYDPPPHANLTRPPRPCGGWSRFQGNTAAAKSGRRGTVVAKSSRSKTGCNRLSGSVLC